MMTDKQRKEKIVLLRATVQEQYVIIASLKSEQDLMKQENARLMKENSRLKEEISKLMQNIDRMLASREQYCID